MNLREHDFEKHVREVCASVLKGKPLSGPHKLQTEITEEAIRRIESQRTSNPEMTLEEIGEYARTVVREIWAEAIQSIQPKQSMPSEYDA